MPSTALALKSDWLNTSVNCIQTSGGSAIDSSGGVLSTTDIPYNYYPYNYYPYNYYYPWLYPIVSSPAARPIKLTLSEIDRLRKAAKADKHLKAILSKFTDQIEITVDFE